LAGHDAAIQRSHCVAKTYGCTNYMNIGKFYLRPGASTGMKSLQSAPNSRPHRSSNNRHNHANNHFYSARAPYSTCSGQAQGATTHV
jgi:hypothetical protein